MDLLFGIRVLRVVGCVCALIVVASIPLVPKKERLHRFRFASQTLKMLFSVN